MAKKRILYVSHEIKPYFPESDLANAGLMFPKKMNSKGNEIRVFMPRFGSINERRHQLHEVIRLSGINVVINDLDQPLIIKVASIPAARIQVYFIDNEDYFKRKGTWLDKENKFYKDNGERTLFFCKSVIETIKKLGWKPDIIHFMGWMSTAMPAYLRQFNSDDPYFNDAKLVYSLFGDGFEGELDSGFTNGINFDGLENMQEFNTPSADNLYAGAVKHVDAVLTMNDDIPEVQLDSATSAGIPIIDGKKFIENPAELDSFYESLFE
jgi:starch synthase